MTFEDLTSLFEQIRKTLTVKVKFKGDSKQPIQQNVKSLTLYKIKI